MNKLFFAIALFAIACHHKPEKPEWKGYQYAVDTQQAVRKEPFDTADWPIAGAGLTTFGNISFGDEPKTVGGVSNDTFSPFYRALNKGQLMNLDSPPAGQFINLDCDSCGPGVSDSAMIVVDHTFASLQSF